MTTVSTAAIAELLRAGATHRQIKEQLPISDARIITVRRTLNIPLPPGRFKRSRPDLDTAEAQAVTMLRAGATYKEVRHATRLTLNDISRLRKQHRIPVPDRDLGANQRRTVDEAFKRYTVPTTTGDHLLWTGARSGRGLDLLAEGRIYNARHVAFRKHHGRDPEGRAFRTCDQPDCIAGAHHTDRRIRQANTRADHAYNAIFGTGDPT